MKVIDLIMNIQNENPIKKFKFRDELFVYDEGKKDYKCSFRHPWFFKEWDWQWSLNDEVEVIEEDKKIEKIEKFKEINMFEINENGYVVCEALLVIIDKINEIIDKINIGE